MNNTLPLPLSYDETFADLDISIVGRFTLYHANNAHIYELFKRFAYEVLASGRKRFSVNAIFERLRWHQTFEVKGDSFKLNNSYRSCYARLLIRDDARFKNFFETRKGGK